MVKRNDKGKRGRKQVKKVGAHGFDGVWGVARGGLAGG